MGKWPKDNQDARDAFYGDPVRDVPHRLVKVYPPFKMFYGGQPITSIAFHEKAAPALQAALAEIWEAYDHDQARIDAAGISEYGGSYNQRRVRGSTTKWSNHAYGAAIDISPTRNAMGTAGDMPQTVIDAFTRQGAMWGGWYNGRKDPMHFEFVDNGGRQPKLPPPHSPTAAPRVVASSTGVDDRVTAIQTALLGMGYPEVGGVDGRLGTKTNGAIQMFLTDNGLASYTTLDTLLTYVRNKERAGFKRQVPPERAFATPADVAAKVPAVAHNATTRTLAKGATIASAVVGVVGNAPDAITTWVPALTSVKGLVGDVPGYVWAILLVVVIGVFWWTSRLTEQAAVADYQTGRTS